MSAMTSPGHVLLIGGALALAGCGRAGYTPGWAIDDDTRLPPPCMLPEDCPPDRWCQSGACRACSGTEDCTDGADDDCDELVDCADPDCGAGTVCRPAAGLCDVPEACDGVTVECPPDLKQELGAVCRSGVGACDLGETCDGVAVDCPADGMQLAGFSCRAATADCDAAEVCTGTTADCPTDVRHDLGAVCRSAAGPCDEQESCDGVSSSCPSDGRVAAGQLCRPAAGICGLDAQCDGNDVLCPANAAVGAGVVCRSAVDACDVTEVCDGASAACPTDEYVAAGIECATGLYCTGLATDCPGANFPTAPIFGGITPSSPSNSSTTPLVRGTASADTVTLTLFSDASCTVSLGAGDKAAFEGPGIAATVLANATTPIYALAVNGAANASPCTYMTTYVHDNVGPTAPTFVATNPSPPQGTAFTVTGLASADSLAVSLFASASCSTLVGTGSKAAFEGAGIAVVLPVNVDTEVYARATDAAANVSACTFLVTYQAVVAWTWMSGSMLANQVGVYGTKGVASTANHPGGRQWPLMWQQSGNLMLFGGLGCSRTLCKTQDLNDLWMFDGTAWTWVAGASSGDQKGVYGTRGVPASTNTPGARRQAQGAMDAAGNFWLFGGWGLDAMHNQTGELNDLWRFDGANWTWIAGSSAIDQTGVYGTKGVANAANVPGGRDGASLWIDASDRVWLYGGTGCDATSCASNTKLLQDVWRFDGSMWTWMAGPNAANTPAVYGTQGVAAPANVPGGRHLHASWLSASGELMVFGGYGFDGVATKGELGDLWRFDGASWTWLDGPNIANQLSVPGTRGLAAATNWPGGRDACAAGDSASSAAWLYGGAGCDATACVAVGNDLSDLWRWDGSTWTWMTGSSQALEAPVYGTLGVPDANNTPGGRYSAPGMVDASGAFWLFGGYGLDSTATRGYRNDLWRIQ